MSGSGCGIADRARRPGRRGPRRLSRASEVAPGDGRSCSRIRRPNDPCILVRRHQRQFVAYSQKCTHLSCAVYYSPEHDRLECPCHEGYFPSTNGRVLQGPPPRPLPRVRLEQRGDDLVAVGMIEEAERMSRMSNPSRRRRRVAIDAAMAMVILVLMVQMWLLTATLESYLAGHHGVAVPALLSSAALFGVCAFLYRLVLRVDRVQEPDEHPTADGAPGPWRIGGEPDAMTVSRSRSSQ